MQILIFSSSKSMDLLFECIVKNRSYSLLFFHTDELKKILRKVQQDAFVYIDVSNYHEVERIKVLKYLSRQTRFRFGIIDLKGKIKDIAGLFHSGASDYINIKIYKEKLSLNRLKKVLSYKVDDINLREKDLEITKKNATASNYIISGNDWKGINLGQEYTFCFMFVKLDDQNEMQKTFGSRHTNKVIEVFRSYIQEVISSINGRIWMWMDFDGLILFPFDGKKCDAILTCFRLILSKKIFIYEKPEFNSLLSFRIALHIGNSVYKKRGETGTIISNSINIIFHLAQKFADESNLYLTQDVFNFIPHGLEKFFISVGAFEGREIMRMRRIL